MCDNYRHFKYTVWLHIISAFRWYIFIVNWFSQSKVRYINLDGNCYIIIALYQQLASAEKKERGRKKKALSYNGILYTAYTSSSRVYFSMYASTIIWAAESRDSLQQQTLTFRIYYRWCYLLFCFILFYFSTLLSTAREND